jgi:hypothetical protein
MNYIKHLTGFFYKISNETSLNPTHISLYLALFQCWNVNRFKNPTGISREEIMKASKINSKATYHKCMKELQVLGYIEYKPTFNPHSSSNVSMVSFSDGQKTNSKFEQPTRSINEQLIPATYPKNEQAIEQVNVLKPNKNKVSSFNNATILENADFSKKQPTKPNTEPLTYSINEPVQNIACSMNEQAIEQVNEDNPNKTEPLKKNTTVKESIEPIQNLTLSKNEQVIEQVNEQVYIYNNKTYKNNINNIYTKSENSNFENSNSDTLEKMEKEKKEKICAKKEKPKELELIFDSEIPTLEMATEYFIFQNSSELEANKFFNYYSSIGWLIGGKTKMKDWKAAARNWIMNQNKFKVNSPTQPLHPQNLNTVTNKNYAEPL